MVNLPQIAYLIKKAQIIRPDIVGFLSCIF